MGRIPVAAVLVAGVQVIGINRESATGASGKVCERGFCLLKGITEGTYNSKHAEAARLYYTTTTTTTKTTHIHTHTHLLSFKLGLAHEHRCDPNHREQHGVARHEAQQHDGARRGGHHGTSL